MSAVSPEWRHPIVGIAMPSHWSRWITRQGPLSVPNTFADTAERMGISTYFFCLNDVRVKERRIRGWVRRGGQWRRQEVPWPDISYEIPSLEPDNEEMRIIRRLRQTTIPINSVFRIGKWQAYSILRNNPQTKAWLPTAVRYRAPEDLVHMIKKYATVIVKPENGQKGKGISRVRIAPNGRYIWERAETGEKRDNLTLDEVIAAVKKTAANQPMVIQRAVPLLQLCGRGTDLRITMHKNRAGKWIASFGGLKIAGPRTFVTNYARGGTWVLFPEGLRRLFPHRDDFNLWNNRLTGIAKTIMLTLERRLGHLGEVGLDIALDRNYRLWFFEANANPGKQTGFERKAGDPPPPWYACVIEYACYLWEHRENYEGNYSGSESGGQRWPPLVGGCHSEQCEEFPCPACSPKPLQ